MITKKLISMGMKYGKPLTDEFIIDVRPLFGRNPYHDKRLRYLRGTDKAVQDDILKTPNFDANYSILKAMVLNSGRMYVYIACTGGHHRSVYLTERIAKELGCEFEHRDIDKGRH